jgi:hypothetical protein
MTTRTHPTDGAGVSARADEIRVERWRQMRLREARSDPAVVRARHERLMREAAQRTGRLEEPNT